VIDDIGAGPVFTKVARSGPVFTKVAR